MQFVDEAQIVARSGKGGDGCISFRREKFVPKGGPDGGDGGNGGDIYLRASSKLSTLYDYRLKRFYAAENGAHGQGKDKHGRSGRDLYIDLPTGTLVWVHENGEYILGADLDFHGKQVLILKGGRGGKGNIHYKSSVDRTPRKAQAGKPGSEKKLYLELKILADAGLIGLPNAGKSTFLSSVSQARPQIAQYPFTTLNPKLGVVFDEKGNQRVLADMPGIIQGAHKGCGLGESFLKHISRTKFLIHLRSIEDIDADSPWSGFELVSREMQKFDKELGKKEQIRVVNKVDLGSEEKVEMLRKKAMQDNLEVYFVSALHGIGISELMEVFWDKLQEE